MNLTLAIIQIVLAIILIILILLQRTGTGIEGAIGGGESSTGVRHTRRGSEKFVFNATIIIAILFAASALLAILL